MKPPTTPPSNRRWLQFSLRTILLLIVVAAIGFSLWTSNQRLKENRRLQTENDALRQRLRSELGELEINDAE